MEKLKKKQRRCSMKIKQKQSKIRDNTRIFVITMSILFFLTISGFYLFNWYINIDIAKTNNRNSEIIWQKKQQKW